MNRTFVAILGALLLATEASAAIQITPATLKQWTGNQTANNQVNAAVEAIIAAETGLGTPLELYKQDAGGGESGVLAPDYSTSFNDDLSGGTISWDGPNYITGPAYLLVKDGKQVPAWYLFDLKDTSNWDGMETLELSGFWPGNGSISHVSLWGYTYTAIPEPASMAVWGIFATVGTMGAAWRRRRLRN